MVSRPLFVQLVGRASCARSRLPFNSTE